MGDAPKQKLPGMFSLMVTMTKTEGGWTALYRGILPTVAGVAPYVRSHSLPVPTTVEADHGYRSG